MEVPHQAFHDAGQAALAANAAGDVERCFAEVAKLEEMSFKVLASLEKLAASGENDSSLLCHA